MKPALLGGFFISDVLPCCPEEVLWSLLLRVRSKGTLKPWQIMVSDGVAGGIA